MNQQSTTIGQQAAAISVIREGSKICLRWGGSVPVTLCDDPGDGTLNVLRMAIGRIIDRELHAEGHKS